MTEEDYPLLRVRCPIHGFIHFSKNERQIINHSLFQRLRYIRQLALTELVYPGATHTRFEHSLGTMEVATRAFDSLAANCGDRMKETFKTVEGFAEDAETMARARQILRLAALLHDIGHTSFSHAAEKAILKNRTHEQLGINLLRNGELKDLVDKLFWEGCAAQVAWLIEGMPKIPPQFKVLNDLISGEMDADRTDYLLRDSYHCGVDYGRFDYRRMIECLDLYEGDGGQLCIALHRHGLHTFEALILARYQMNTQVYYHRLRGIYDIYLRKYYEALAQHNTDEEILGYNDIVMMARIVEDARGGQGERKKWAEKIYNRNHHRCIFDSGAIDKVEGISQKINGVIDILKSRYSDREFLTDAPSPVSIHKQAPPKDEAEKERFAPLMVKGSGDPQPIYERSQILSKIPSSFMFCRAYVDSADRQLIEEIRNVADNLWRAHRKEGE